MDLTSLVCAVRADVVIQLFRVVVNPVTISIVVSFTLGIAIGRGNPVTISIVVSFIVLEIGRATARERV